ncbi:MAG: aldehyde ferredoxin oxidoreductase C-terminal domain-containing protein, partial [Planctomycetaceae bacterium]
MHDQTAPVAGYHGRYLQIDLTRQRVVSVPIPQAVFRQFIGGVGLGTWILLQETDGEYDPLAPDAPLVFVFSPLVGSPLTTSAKFAVLCKSPLTHRLNDSLASSQFALAGKKTGYDGLLIRGQSPQATCLLIDEDGVRFESADDVWGLSPAATTAALRTRFDRGWRFAAIGTAGENLVRYATISHDGRHAGRGGSGAVMGAKRLKAVGVNGQRSPRFADPEQLAAYSKSLSRLSMGPATAKYRELGTVSNLLTFNRLGTLPTRNFQESTFAGASALAPPVDDAASNRTRSSCAACTIGCEHIFHAPSQPAGVRLEYESLFALGSLCGIEDFDTVLKAAALCDEFGMDTISSGACIAFAMECTQRGLLDDPELNFGNNQALLDTLSHIALRRDLGDLLADGTRMAASRIGGNAADFAPHVKGLEIPGYEPRALQTMALGFAVNTRGADHNRSGAYQVDFSDQVDRLNIDRQAVVLAI